MGQVHWERSVHPGTPHTHAEDGLLTISAMAALECCAAEKIMSSAPSKGARTQLLLETCRLGWDAAIWPGGPAITTTRHSTALPCRPA